MTFWRAWAGWVERARGRDAVEPTSVSKFCGVFSFAGILADVVSRGKNRNEKAQFMDRVLKTLNSGERVVSPGAHTPRDIVCKVPEWGEGVGGLEWML